MKIFKTMVGSDDGVVYQVDTLRHRGGLWLVPRWLESPTEKLRRPARIIRIDTLPHQKVKRGPDSIPADYVLNGPIPKAVLDGANPKAGEQQFVVEEMPQIALHIPRRDLN